MKLSKLVAYINHLDKFHPLAALDGVTTSLDPVLHTVKNHELQFNDYTELLALHRGHVVDQIQQFDQTLISVKARVKKDIEVLEHEYLLASYRLYTKDIANDSNDIILNRCPRLLDDVQSHIRGRLSRFNDWHHPGMIVRPSTTPWITDLVALDPLYLIDTNHDLITPAVNQFPQEYQNRLRTYVIQETLDSKMLAKLPQGQIGFILAYHYFNFRPLEIIRCFMQEMFDVLKPGGTLAFTFNDCDKSGAVDLAERCFMCYTPGRLVVSAAELLGFQVSHMFHLDGASTWIEVVKPGELTSLRGGQSLAKIVAKPKQI